MKISVVQKRKLIIVLALSLFVLISLIVLLYSKIENIFIKDEFLCYQGGEVLHYDSNTKADINGNRMMIGDDIIQSSPLTTKDILITSRNMIYYPLKDFDIKKVDIGTTIKKNKQNIILESGKKQTEIENGLLFDGKNTYIFLQDVVLHYNDKEVKLPQLSYLTYENSMLSYFDFSSQKGNTEKVQIDGIVAECSAYTVDIEGSLIEKGDNALLLFTNPSSLKSVFGGE